jgi:DNA helicase-2/ATP-dependent DNA helicase PcrA
MSSAYLEKLNPEQRKAVEHGVRERACEAATPLLVIAGAGSGKTNTLAHRVAHLIVSGADPRRILLMTFSRRAASEMTRRVERICAQVMGTNGGIMADALTWAGTFHAIGARLLREYAEQIGLQPQFTIHDREDSADLMNLIRHELGFSKTESRFPTKGTCLAIYSRAVNAEMSLDLALQDYFPWCAGWHGQLCALFEAYVAAKQTQGVLDYDDLLLYWAQTVSDPVLAADIGERFDHVLVDEYQDTNRLQSSILLALKPGGAGLTVVGDDAQSIYSFRAATVRNILDFPGQFSPPAAIITLDRNYRSTQPILAAANGVIDLAAERFTKNLRTERQSRALPELISVRDEADQARYVAERVLANREVGTTLKQQAVLFRTSHHSGPLESAPCRETSGLQTSRRECFGASTCEDVYAGWERTDGQFFWKDLTLNIVPLDRTYYERRDALAFEMAECGDRKARDAILRIIQRDQSHEKRARAEKLLERLDAA